MQELTPKYLESLRGVTGDIQGDIRGLCEWLAALPWNGDRKRQFTAEEIQATCFPKVAGPVVRHAREVDRRRQLRDGLSREPYVPHVVHGLHKGDAVHLRQILKAHATYHGLTLRTFTPPGTTSMHYMLCDRHDAPPPTVRGDQPNWTRQR